MSEQASLPEAIGSAVLNHEDIGPALRNGDDINGGDLVDVVANAYHQWVAHHRKSTKDKVPPSWLPENKDKVTLIKEMLHDMGKGELVEAYLNTFTQVDIDNECVDLMDATGVEEVEDTP